MKNNVFCMASAKGGSGKTILTSSFAAFLSSIGKKVLIVDVDAATNGLTLLHLKEIMIEAELIRSKGKEPVGIFESTILREKLDIVKLENNVDMVPATYEFQNTEQLLNERDYERAVFNFLSEVKDSYDYIFLDAQAGSDVYARIAMSRHISDQVIIVSEYDPISAAGIERLKGLFRDILTYDRTWVLLNKMLPDFVKSFSNFLEIAKYLSPIPWDADVIRSYAKKKLPIDFESGNEFTLAIIQALKSLLDENISTELDNWLQDRETKIRQPISEQYELLVKELSELESRHTYLMEKIKKYSRYRTFMSSDLFIPLIGVPLVFLFYSLSPIFKDGLNTINTSEILLGNNFLKTLSALIITLLAIVTYLKIKQKVGIINELRTEKNAIDLRLSSRKRRLRNIEFLNNANLETLIGKRNNLNNSSLYGVSNS